MVDWFSSLAAVKIQISRDTIEVDRHLPFLPWAIRLLFATLCLHLWGCLLCGLTSTFFSLPHVHVVVLCLLQLVIVPCFSLALFHLNGPLILLSDPLLSHSSLHCSSLQPRALRTVPSFAPMLFILICATLSFTLYVFLMLLSPVSYFLCPLPDGTLPCHPFSFPSQIVAPQSPACCPLLALQVSVPQPVHEGCSSSKGSPWFHLQHQELTLPLWRG